MSDPYDLIAAYLDGELDESGAAELEAWLEADDANVETFAREVHAHSAVRQHLLADAAIRDVDREASTHAASASTRRRAAVAAPRRGRALAVAGILAIAACLLAVLWWDSPAEDHDGDRDRIAAHSTVTVTTVPRDVATRAEPAADVSAAPRPEPAGDAAPPRAPRTPVPPPGPVEATPPPVVARTAPARATDADERGERAVDESRNIAYLDAAQGEVQWSSDERSPWRPAPTGVGIPSGGRFRTRVSRARVVLESGSVVNVDGFTTLAIARADGLPTVTLVGGQVLIEVAPRDKGLVVATPHGRARDLGTVFGVAVRQSGTTVTVVRGEVEASTDVGSATIATRREVLLYRRTSVPGFVVPAANLAARYAWVIRVPREIVTTSFQDGVAPDERYAGTADTYLSQEDPDDSFGTDRVILADGRSPEGDDYAALVRWDVSAIPPRSRVHSVIITLYATDTCHDESYPVYTVLRAWDERSATWQSPDGRARWQALGGVGARDRSRAAITAVGPCDVGPLEITLDAEGLAVVQRWVDDPSSNHGIAIASATNSDGIDFASREAKRADRRPRLTITYRPPYRAADEAERAPVNR